jgi:Protein of unknown function, DUF481
MMADKMKAVIIIISCIMTGIKSLAQFSDSIHHNIGYAATGIINQTDNTSSFVLNNNLKFNVNKKNKFLNSSASWVYGRQNGVLTNNDFNSTVNFDIYGKLPHLYYWGLAAYDKSASLKINDRFQGGLGIGYNFLDKQNAAIGLSDGILYEYSDLQDTISAHDTYRTLRNSLRLKYHFVWKGIIVFDGVQFWQPSLSSSKDYVLKSINSLSVKLKKWLSVTSAMNYNKVNRTQSRNFLFTAGLTADYYF